MKFNIPVLFIFLLANLLFTGSLFSQREKDSLIRIIETTSDSNTVNTILIVAKKYFAKDTNRAKEMFNSAIDLSLKLKYKQGLTVAWCQKADYLYNINGDSAGFKCLRGLLNYVDTIKPDRFYAKYLITEAGFCVNNGQYEKAVNAYLKSLKICDLINNKEGSAIAYHGLSFVNTRMNNHNKGEYYGLKALALYTELKDGASCARINSLLGGAFFGKAMQTKSAADYSKTYQYLTSSAEQCMKLGDIHTAAVCYTNLAGLFGFRENYGMALSYCRKALKLKRETGNKHGISATLQMMSNIFAVQKQADSIGLYAFQALTLAKEINSPTIIRSSYNDVSTYYELKKDHVKALEYFKLYKSLNDSLEYADKLKTLTDIESKYESDKKDKEIGLLGELQKVKDKEISKQRTINIITIGGLFLVLLLSFFIFRQYSQKKKANNLLETQNHLIAEKNRNITDSINYAKVIQNALLPQETEFISVFPKAFILFKPKDIVSGDFYWFAEKNGKKIVAAVDCTGHGVPGAFMSMIGITFLNEIINEKGITRAADILGEMRNRVKASLKQRGMEGESRDGMDMSVLCFSEDFKTVEYAGANNPLWRVTAEGGFHEIAPDKRPIGYYKGQGLPFSNHKIQLEKGDCLYIFTDGYADQFGGLRGKKFKYKQLKDILITHCSQSMQLQKEFLASTLNEWQGNMEQTDDVCLVGIKI